LRAGGERQCQKSGKAFPPNAGKAAKAP